VDNRRRGCDKNEDYGMREACRLALRNLLFLRARTIVPLLLIAVLACGLDFFAGCQRVLMQQEASRAAFAQGLGQLAIVPAEGRSFADGQPERLRDLAATTRGVALAVPHLDRHDALQYLAIYIANPGDEDVVLDTLATGLGRRQLPASVIHAGVLSDRYRAARRVVNAQLGGAGLGLLALAGVISYWAAAVNGERRRRELMVLRSFGLQRRGVMPHVMAEGILVGIGAVILAALLSSVTSWLAGGFGWHMPVELDPVRLLGTLTALLGVSIASAAIPALRRPGGK
jgi:hypothetical protein